MLIMLFLHIHLHLGLAHFLIIINTLPYVYFLHQGD